MRALTAGLAAVLLVATLPPLAGLLVIMAVPGAGLDAVRPSSAARDDIPVEALRDYQDAARLCPGLSWTVLAAVGKVESDHGRSGLPGVHSGQNEAGAMGPMQFLPATWEASHLPGMDDVYDLRDAAFAAARYLCANGAGIAERLRQAIFAYNHAWWYVDQVLGWAAAYASDALETVIAGPGQPGDPFAGACRPLVTQPYGPTGVAGEPVVNGVRFHTGIDLACPQGEPVHSLTDGVAHVATGWDGGFGNSVVVEVITRLPGDLLPERYFIRYAHLLDGLPMADGAVVHAGDLVGFEGSSGRSSGPHLHFEIDRGRPAPEASIDPAPLLAVA